MALVTRRKLFVGVLTCFLSLSMTVLAAYAAELLATVKSVDVDAKKITVTPKDAEDKEVVVTIKDDTEWTNAKGKKLDNFDLAKVKKGFVLEITHEDAVASKVVIKKGAAKKKEAPKAN